jgi:hypothetical protein
MKVGQRVKIINPLVFIRCGYPLSRDDIIKRFGDRRIIVEKPSFDSEVKGMLGTITKIKKVQTCKYERGHYTHTLDGIDYHTMYLSDVKIHQVCTVKLDNCTNFQTLAKNLEIA